MRKGLSLGPGAHQLGWLKSEPQKSICLHLRDAGITNAQPHWLLHRCGWSDSCSQACLADTLPTELLPQSQRWWLFKNLYPIYNLTHAEHSNEPIPTIVFCCWFCFVCLVLSKIFELQPPLSGWPRSDKAFCHLRAERGRRFRFHTSESLCCCLWKTLPAPGFLITIPHKKETCHETNG